MTQVLEEGSAEAYASNFAIFGNGYVDMGGQTIYYQDHQAISSIKDGQTLDFHIRNSSSSYWDMSRTRLHVSAKLTLKNGGRIPEPTTTIDKDGVTEVTVPDEARCTVVNNTLSSLFKCVDTTLGQTPLGNYIGNNYSFKSYIDVLFFCSESERQTELTDCLYTPEIGQYLADLDAYSSLNEGLKTRHEFVKGGRIFHMSGRLFSDIMALDRLIINGLDLDFKLHRNDPRFCLMSSATTPHEFQIEIVSASIRMCYIRPTASLLLAQSRVLEKHAAVYPYVGSVLKTFSIGRGERSIVVEDFFNSQIPHTLIFGLLDTQAFHGSYKTNPYLFKGYGLELVSLKIDGSTHPPTCIKNEV